MKTQHVHIPAILFLVLCFIPSITTAESSQQSSAPTELDVTNQSNTTAGEDSLLDQLKLFFHIGETTRALDLEESGISGIGDTAGQSVGKRQLLVLARKYRQQVAQNPKDVAAWIKLGTILETLGREKDSLAAYKKIFELNPGSEAARQGIHRYEKSHQVLARVYTSFQHQEEYAPSISRDIATWEEQTTNVQISKSWGRGKTFGIGWLDSTIYQKNELYGDVDFSLKRQAPFAYFSWPLMQGNSMALRIRDEKFTNDDDSGFYRVDGSEHIITGYLNLIHRSESFWTNVTYSREREPDPMYDLENSRSALNIEVKELTGISGGYALAPSYELGASLYYEQYGSARNDQFNPNIQLSHWPGWLPGLRLSLGYGYYTDETENIINLTTSYQLQPYPTLLLRCEYQLEYSENEDSLLNQGDILMSWSVTRRISLTVRADYSMETGDDEDSNFYAQASLNWAIY